MDRSVDQSKSFSESDSNMLMASTDTLIQRKDLPDQIKHDVRKFLRLVWDSDKMEFFKKTDWYWARFLLFQLVFMIALAGYAAIGFGLYMEVYVDKNHPRTQGNDTLLVDRPALGYRPMPDQRQTMIRFVQGQPDSYKPYSDHVQAWLLQYENQAQESEAFIDCANLAEKDRNIQKACRFQINDLGARCVWQQDYGYDQGMPCVLLKLNKIFNWRPKLYNESDVPPEVREWDRRHGNHKFYLGNVTVTCEGENPIDEENMGPIIIEPAGGFPIHYYPYLNQEGYRAPLVMLQFAKPTNGIIINVWCKAWAPNIPHHRWDDQGSIHFELLID